LEGLDVATRGSNLPVTVSASVGTSERLSTLPIAARPAFLDTTATGYIGLTVTNTTVRGDWLRLVVTKTNGTQVSLSVTNNSADTNVSDLCQLLLNAVNAEPALQGGDGVIAADLFPAVDIAQFLLYVRTVGWPAAQARVELTSSSDLTVIPTGTHPFEDNLTDLRPRNHLYISVGQRELSLSPTLDTSQLPDGYHELTVVGYEGSGVRTQTRVSRAVRIQNTTLSASLSANFAGTNVTADSSLSFSVAANSNAIARIELFGTGGLIGTVSNQALAAFTVPAPVLGVGLHSFYALVTDPLGHQYRTQPLNIRIVPSIELSISGQPFILSWLAEPGIAYDVVSSTNLASSFQKVATVVASGLIAQWPVPNQSGAASFFRVQVNQ